MPTQDKRHLRVDTPLGKDKFLLRSFEGQEAISSLFEFHLEMLSGEASIDPSKIVGKAITFSAKLFDGSKRYFNGHVKRFVSTGAMLRDLRVYRCEVVPWLWFLTRTSDCRIFQNKTVVEIVEAIFQELGFGAYSTSGLQNSYEPYEYCVQYRETDFAFISRLLEQEGIFYFFTYGDGEHKLILGDQNTAFESCVENQVEYAYSDSGGRLADRILSWEHGYEFRSGKWTQSDYNFLQPAATNKTPSNIQLTTEESVVKLPDISKYELFEYPGKYDKKALGSTYAKVRMEAEEVPYDVVHGSSNYRTFFPGGKFQIKKHSDPAEVGKEYVCTSVSHRGSDPSDLLAGESTDMPSYRNEFTCIPSSVAYRPARKTPRPYIRGNQTAVVVGPPGSEIYTDEHGRVKVQFFWDRLGERNENSSCWIRCAQPSAGKQWGAFFLPRIGQEVVVSFLEGDPDRPLITGVVYNAEQTPHYKLPDEQTKSYWKSNSSTGGEGYNEIRFEDKAGNEQIFINAQRNLDLRVLKDSMEKVIGDRHLIVGDEEHENKSGNQYEMVLANKHLNVKANQVEKIEGNISLTVGKGEADGGKVDILIEKDRATTIEGSEHFHVKTDQNEKVDGNVSLTVGGDQQEKISGAYAFEAGKTVYIKAGQTLVLEAGMQLSLKVGGNFIDIGSGGVSITGSMVNINSGGSPASGSPPSPTGPTDASPDAPTEPTPADDSKSGVKSAPDSLN